MSPAAGVAIMMNNYFHDVATALLAASSVALWVMLRRYEAGQRGADAARYFLEIQGAMVKLARFSLAWIRPAPAIRSRSSSRRRTPPVRSTWGMR